MKKNRNCIECQKQEVAEMLVTTATSFPDRPMGVPDQPMRHSSPSRAAHAVIKSRIAKRIAELGPLGEVKSSPASMLYRKDKETTADVVGADNMLTLAEFAKEEVAIASGSVAASPKLLAPSVTALKKRLVANAQRAVSEDHAHLLTISHKEERAISASFRPLPPLPTPVNFDGLADKIYRSASQNSIDGPLSAAAHNEHKAGENAEDTEADATNKENENENVPISRIDFSETPSRTTSNTQQGKEDEVTSRGAKKHVHFGEKNTETNEHNDSVVYEDSDISTLDLGDSADNYDPFVDDIQQQMAALSLRSTSGAERPLPPIPTTKSAKRHSVPSPHDGLERLIFSSRSMHNFAQPDEQPAQHSPTPQRQTRKLPCTVAKFAAFDFHLGYDRGKIGYIGRIGQKGSGDDFNHDWKLEYGFLDYSKDETATGDLWENKHGFGYAGLKRHLNKLNDERKADGKKNPSKESPGKNSAGKSVHFSSPRPNKESTIWSRRWSRNDGFPISAPVLKGLNGAGKTDVESIVKMQSGETHVILASARKEKYEDVPWDRTMIGCAL